MSLLLYLSVCLKINMKQIYTKRNNLKGKISHLGKQIGLILERTPSKPNRLIWECRKLKCEYNEFACKTNNKDEKTMQSFEIFHLCVVWVDCVLVIHNSLNRERKAFVPDIPNILYLWQSEMWSMCFPINNKHNWKSASKQAPKHTYVANWLHALSNCRNCQKNYLPTLWVKLNKFIVSTYETAYTKKIPKKNFWSLTKVWNWYICIDTNKFQSQTNHLISLVI